MIRIATAVIAVAMITAAAAQPQQPPYTLSLSAPQIQRLWIIIQKVPLPREETEELAVEIMKQIRSQDAARETQQKKLAE